MLDLSRYAFAPEVTASLMARGASLPPLDWSSHANKLAKNTLDTVTDEKLFGRHKITSEPHASGVRALLYLWNGCLADAEMYTQTLTGNDNNMLLGICARHRHDSKRAKQHLAAIAKHPIYPKLASFTLEVITPQAGPLCHRLKQAVELNDQWDPMLFIDLCTLATQGKLSRRAETVIRQIQCTEFELLLAYMYRHATGIDPLQKAKTSQGKDDEERIKRMRDLVKQHNPSRFKRPGGSASKDTASAEEQLEQLRGQDAPDNAESPFARMVKIGCPRCSATSMVPSESRGKVIACKSCGQQIAVPTRPGKVGGTAPPPPDTMPIQCPSCASVLRVPNTAAGKILNCTKCNARFRVPQKKTAATT